MYKLIDCGTYPFFIKKSNKYFHCVYHLNGEHKKYKIQNSYAKNLNERTKYGYLKDHLVNFDKAECKISKWKITYRKMLKYWKSTSKTLYMKEVLQQLKKLENKNG